MAEESKSLDFVDRMHVLLDQLENFDQSRGDQNPDLIERNDKPESTQKDKFVDELLLELEHFEIDDENGNIEDNDIDTIQPDQVNISEQQQGQC